MPSSELASSILKKQFRPADWFAERIIKSVAFLSITFVVLIFVFVFRETLPLFHTGAKTDVTTEVQSGPGLQPDSYSPDAPESTELKPESYSPDTPESPELKPESYSPGHTGGETAVQSAAGCRHCFNRIQSKVECRKP